jgi:hypothetical protein
MLAQNFGATIQAIKSVGRFNMEKNLTFELEEHKTSWANVEAECS